MKPGLPKPIYDERMNPGCLYTGGRIEKAPWIRLEVCQIRVKQYGQTYLQLAYDEPLQRWMDRFNHKYGTALQALSQQEQLCVVRGEPYVGTVYIRGVQYKDQQVRFETY